MSECTSPLRHRGALLALAVAVLGTVSLPRPSAADTIASTQARANQIAAQIEALGSKDSDLSQQYDGAVLRAQQTDAQVGAVEAQLAAANLKEQQTKAKLKAQAVKAFIEGRDSQNLFDLLQGSGKELIPRSEFLRVAANQEDDALDQARVAEDRVAAEKKSLEAAQAQEHAAMALLTASRNQVEQTEGQLNTVYSQVKGELAAEVQQAQAAQAAADAAAARARFAAAVKLAQAQQAPPAEPPSPRPAPVAAQPTVPSAPAGLSAPHTNASSGGGGAIRAPSVPVSGGAGTAVAVAEAQVGKPYVWGAAGPDAFDCSGLVMYAWAAAGVSLPHYTVDQYDSTTHISLGQLQPGDLVFNASLGHVAMYVGGGMMVEAPYTGADVRIVPLRSEMVLASRP